MSAPMEAAARPFPSDESTPPVMKMNLDGRKGFLPLLLWSPARGPAFLYFAAFSAAAGRSDRLQYSLRSFKVNWKPAAPRMYDFPVALPPDFALKDNLLT
jgi:hypothetical protein